MTIAGIRKPYNSDTVVVNIGLFVKFLFNLGVFARRPTQGRVSTCFYFKEQSPSCSYTAQLTGQRVDLFDQQC